jgi:hypothetical protein
VTDSGCNLAVGCGHGQFPRPTVRADGTFDVDGKYRIEVGPISIDLIVTDELLVGRPITKRDSGVCGSVS